VRVFAGGLIILLLLIGNNGCREGAPNLLTAKTAPGVTIEGVNVGDLRQDQLEAAVGDLALKRHIMPRNAFFESATGEIVPEIPGREVEVAATMRAALAAAPSSSLAALYTKIEPEITRNKLSSAVKLAAYATDILDRNPDRSENIRLTAALINNAVLEPGEEFSFNRRTGEPTAERGFRYAVVFNNGRQELGLGGGMCQVSSTLYNAVIQARLKVTERHQHSQPVSYVPAGQDATTYTDKDLRFVNSARHLVMIKALIKGEAVWVEIWELPK
jgi:vancomycin resistance protein YoaR